MTMSKFCEYAASQYGTIGKSWIVQNSKFELCEYARSQDGTNS